MVVRNDENLIRLMGRKERVDFLLRGDYPFYNFKLPISAWSEEQSLFYLQFVNGEITAAEKPAETNLYTVQSELMNEYNKLVKLYQSIVQSIRADKPHRYKKHFAAIGKAVKDMSQLVTAIPLCIVEAEELLLKGHFEPLEENKQFFLDGYTDVPLPEVPQRKKNSIVLDFPDERFTYEQQSDGYSIRVKKSSTRKVNKDV